MSSRTGLPVPLTVIADQTGVSVATVSKVLNSRPDVAPATRERVASVLASYGVELTRRPPRRTGLVDLRVENLLGIWSEELVRGVIGAAKAQRFDVVVSVGPQQDDCHEWISHALERGSDGLISVVGVPSAADQARVADAGLPLVIVDPWVLPSTGTLSVGATNWQGALEATGHLIELGHRRIATITGSLNLENALARLGGFRSALIRAGLKVDESLIRVGDYSPSAGYQAAQYFLGLDDPPTAIFAASDDSALGAMRAYHEAGASIPRDISIMGFDDLPTGVWAEPSLSTVHQPLEQMGEAAVDLIQRYRDGRTAPHRVELATSLVIRNTTTAPSHSLNPA